jgi:hypothetical protein
VTQGSADDEIEISDGTTRWRFDRSFLASRWTCIWGRGCKGILGHPAEELQQGCCSVGVELADAEEAMTVAAYAATLPPDLWQHHDRVDEHDVFRDGARLHTKVVDGACIFLNRPGFPGGAGCALHLAADAEGESPVDWKPSACWQLPLRVDSVVDEDGSGEVVTVRRWRRDDWGDDAVMAWWCTSIEEAPEAFGGERPVVDSLADELRAIAGDEVYVELRRRLP